MQHLEITTDHFVNPGVFIDIDGVVLQGGKPFPWSKEAIHALWNNDIPFVFVTNGTYCSAVLVENLTKILELPFTSDHVVVAPSPCTALTDFHDKHVLVCCQEDSHGLVPELGFSNYLTVEELVEIFPDLDYVDHNRRKYLLSTPLSDEQKKAQEEFRPIEAILLLGEPIHWECSLQILIDILMTSGDPRAKFKFVPSPHLPIIAANKDLTFKGAAALPRFGHGAFLECLESLYKKITKNELEYEELMGKPYLVTYEYAAEQIQRLSKNGAKINKFFMIGDNPEVDVKGASIFKEHLHSLEAKSSRRSSRHASCATSRRHSLVVPDFSEFEFRQTKHVESILVCTGVYNPSNDLMVHLRSLFDSKICLDSNNNQADGEHLNESNYFNVPIIKTDSSNQFDFDTNELRNALSRKNSFISYFDDHQNMPDLTVDNLKDAVEHIIKVSRV
ncbi:unnamed protein product [Brachionus calyciflorus]|uniref:Cat eye syndrome critical region protein 5 n=1 Tax=Brachionus calyciflorus TaxID=104777 RepID=A0A813P3K9_9BILA|nr:unnamed protein product [Brachionus calyciflorus]